MFVKGGVPGNPTPTHCNLITCSMTAPPASYRPTVFFRHLLVAVSFPQTNIQGGFKKVCYFYLLKYFKSKFSQNTNNLFSIKVSTCFDSESHHLANY
jgi:hypothetical protein